MVLVSRARFPLPKNPLLLSLLFFMLLWLSCCGWVGCVCSPELPLAASLAAPSLQRGILTGCLHGWLCPG